MKPESMPAKLLVEAAKRLSDGDRVSLVSLVVANLLPILCALIFGWSLGGVVIFYWWENIIIGCYAILRILFAKPMLAVTRKGPSEKLFLVPFFCFHYFFFCLVHGGILMGILSFGNGFDGSSSSAMDFPDHNSWPGPLFVIPAFFGVLRSAWEVLPTGAFLSINGLVVSHGISWLRNYIGKREFERTSPVQEMFRPYGRIVLLHVSLIFGGIATLVLGSPAFLVILLMIGKTVMDVAVHTASHSGTSVLGTMGFRPGDVDSD